MNERSVVCLSGLGASHGEWEAATPYLNAFGHVSLAMPARGSVILVGHSHGGVRALRLATDQVDRIEAVVLTSCFWPPTRGDRSTWTAVADYGRHRAQYAREVNTRERRPNPTLDGARQLVSLARLGLRPQRFHRLASEVRCPVLAIHGENDHVVPVTFARAAVAAHPAWRYREIGGAGHHPHRDQPADWAKRVVEWLDAATVARPPQV